MKLQYHPFLYCLFNIFSAIFPFYFSDKGEENAGFDLSPAPTGKGFDLSPVRKEAPGFDLSPVHKEAPGFDLSPVRKEAPGFDLSPVQKEAPGFDLSPVQKYAAGFDSSPDLKEAPCYLDQEDDSGLNLRPVTDGVSIVCIVCLLTVLRVVQNHRIQKSYFNKQNQK